MDLAHCFLDGNADAVEFCPQDSYHHVLAASTYTLHEGDMPTRCGSISIFTADAESGQLELFHCLETAGIFDIRWSPVGGNMGPLLAQADAEGFLRIHHLGSDLNKTAGIGYVLVFNFFDFMSYLLNVLLPSNSFGPKTRLALANGVVFLVS